MGLIVGIWGDFVSEQAYPTIWSHVQLRKSQMKYLPLSGAGPSTKVLQATSFSSLNFANAPSKSNGF